MTFSTTNELAGKRVVKIFCGERYIFNQKLNHNVKLVNGHFSFNGKSKIFFVL